jgi:TRAP-type C4-dicarboxylate transport system substrate-binding protein
LSVAYQRVYDKMLAKFDENKGVHVLSVFTHGPGQIYNTKRPVTSLKDLEGLKIRVGGGLVNEVAKALGTVPMLKPAPESYELLSQGVADGLFFPKESPVSFKLVPLIKYVTYVPGGLYNVSFAMVMNPAKWNQISQADRAAIDKLSGEALARRAGLSWDEADRKGMEALKKSGVKIVNANSEMVAEVRKRSAPIIDDWIAKANGKGVDAAKILAEFREELKKVAAAK